MTAQPVERPAHLDPNSETGRRAAEGLEQLAVDVRQRLRREGRLNLDPASTP